ncbi:MAG: hypothetical protein ACK4UN_09980 [Limisphaerales bacterium]
MPTTEELLLAALQNIRQARDQDGLLADLGLNDAEAGVNNALEKLRARVAFNAGFVPGQDEVDAE